MTNNLALDFVLKTFKHLGYNHIKFVDPLEGEKIELILKEKIKQGFVDMESFCTFMCISELLNHLIVDCNIMEKKTLIQFISSIFNDYSQEEIESMLDYKEYNYLYYELFIEDCLEKEHDETLHDFIFKIHTLLLTICYLIEIKRKYPKQLYSILMSLTIHIQNKLLINQLVIHKLCKEEIHIIFNKLKLSTQDRTTTEELHQRIMCILEVCYYKNRFDLIEPWALFTNYKEIDMSKIKNHIHPVVEINDNYFLKPYVLIHKQNDLEKSKLKIIEEIFE